MDIGVVSLSELFFKEQTPTKKNIDSAVDFINKTLLESKEFNERLLIGVAGTFTSLASIYLKQSRFNEDEIHQTEMKKDDVSQIHQSIIKMSEPQIITNFKGIYPKRAKTIQAEILLANQIMFKYNVHSIRD